jgi:exosortase A-associated hydrolase 1
VKYAELALQFCCADEVLIGVLSAPTAPPAAGTETALIIVVGGPQYRVGSHRQFTLLARALAAGGVPTARFDYRGMGDSSGPLFAFDAVSADIEAAINAVQRARPSVRDVVLWGLCDGASAALLYVHERRDPRVRGMCLVNPWVRSAQSLAQTHIRHYYWDRIRQPDFWRKLVHGGIARRAFGELAQNVRVFLQRKGEVSTREVALPFQRRMAQAWQTYDGPILLVLSGDDYVAREFGEQVRHDVGWRGALERRGVTRLDLAAANHTFSDPVDARKVEAATLEWLQDTAVLRTFPRNLE